ncbi:MAG TPA: AarF/UbiB family protein [Egicoccus sp.]|nr:AarF/UbiB family protein [Egicoccus sp.]HSK24571.1 AarF/UbiB family protein [Egicoccus sp.]
MSLLGNLALVVVFAWVVRRLLAAREVTWPRLVLAVLVGSALGATVAGVLLIDVTDPERLLELQRLPDGFGAVALPFQVLATMLAVVVFEAVAARPPQARLHRVRPWRTLRRGLAVLARGWQVSRILVRHGLAPALGLRRGDIGTRDPEELARRARTALEDAGGMFVKLGQLLASRPDLLPPVAVAELGRLHAGARPLPRDVVEQAATAELGRPPGEVFAEIDWTPLGSASIAQVHAARLHDGREVVIKLRRPGLLASVERDLMIAVWLARLAERRTAWGWTYEVGAIAVEFADALRTELDLRVEGRHAAQMYAAMLERPDVRAPFVVEELTTERLLVMERLVGTPLSRYGRDQLEAGEARRLADLLCASQVEAMLRGERFHGDPHPGNVLVLDDGRLGLIDFGATGRLDTFEQSSVFQMLLAIHLGEPALLYESLVAVGAVPAVRDPDEIERRLARFLAAHLGPGLPPAAALTDLLRLTTALGFRLPPQTSAMFRALATLAGTLEHLSPAYPLIDEVAALGGAELRGRASPSSLREFVEGEWAQLGPLLRRAPRHLDRLATVIEHGGLTTRVRLFADAADVAVVERLLNRTVLTAIGLGVGLISVLMLAIDAGPVVAGTAIRLLEVFAWGGLFGSSVLLLRVLLQVIHASARDTRSA